LNTIELSLSVTFQAFVFCLGAVARDQPGLRSRMEKYGASFPPLAWVFLDKFLDNNLRQVIFHPSLLYQGYGTHLIGKVVCQPGIFIGNSNVVCQPGILIGTLADI